MSSDRKRKIEEIIVALLETQEPFLSTDYVKRHDEDTDTLTFKNRVIVKAAEPTPHLPQYKPDTTPAVLESVVDITVLNVNLPATTTETWVSAIDTALDTSPTAVQTLAASYFSSGFQLDPVESGTRNDDRSEQREVTKSVRVVFRP